MVIDLIVNVALYNIVMRIEKKETYILKIEEKWI